MAAVKSDDCPLITFYRPCLESERETRLRGIFIRECILSNKRAFLTTFAPVGSSALRKWSTITSMIC